MDTKELLQLVAEKKVSVDDALLELKKEPFEDLGFAKPDFHRKLRQGVGEVIYGAGKTPDQIAKISESFIKNNQSNILITRMSKEASDYVEKYLEALEVTYFYDETWTCISLLCSNQVIFYLILWSFFTCTIKREKPSSLT